MISVYANQKLSPATALFYGWAAGHCFLPGFIFYSFFATSFRPNTTLTNVNPFGPCRWTNLSQNETKTSAEKKIMFTKIVFKTILGRAYSFPANKTIKLNDLQSNQALCIVIDKNRYIFCRYLVYSSRNYVFILVMPTNSEAPRSMLRIGVVYANFNKEMRGKEYRLSYM